MIVSLDRFGRLDEIEDADYDSDRVTDRRAIRWSDAERIAREAVTACVSRSSTRNAISKFLRQQEG